jgi:hypothetical protein
MDYPEVRISEYQLKHLLKFNYTIIRVEKTNKNKEIKLIKEGFYE